VVPLIIDQMLTLKKKQSLTVHQILKRALSWRNHPYDATRRQQLLLRVVGKAGVGKSHLIKAIVAGMELIGRKHEVILLGPTGSAADNINGNTYHSALGITLSKKQKPDGIKHLWLKKTIMVIDEISMTDLATLSVINKRCKFAKAQPSRLLISSAAFPSLSS
jgi:AAA domain-containing protein